MLRFVLSCDVTNDVIIASINIAVRTWAKTIKYPHFQCSGCLVSNHIDVNEIFRISGTIERYKFSNLRYVDREKLSFLRKLFLVCNTL